MNWVRTLPCCAYDDGKTGRCANATTDAHHAGKRAAGRKADDNTCIPFCHWHHMCWHSASGFFTGMTREERRRWADARITETQAKWDRREMGSEECPF